VLDEVIKIVSSNHGLSIHGFSGFMPGTYFWTHLSCFTRKYDGCHVERY
jgi:hypothetical protein